MKNVKIVTYAEVYFKIEYLGLIKPEYKIILDIFANKCSILCE